MVSNYVLYRGNRLNLLVELERDRHKSETWSQDFQLESEQEVLHIVYVKIGDACKFLVFCRHCLPLYLDLSGGSQLCQKTDVVIVFPNTFNLFMLKNKTNKQQKKKQSSDVTISFLVKWVCVHNSCYHSPLMAIESQAKYFMSLGLWFQIRK